MDTEQSAAAAPTAEDKTAHWSPKEKARWNRNGRPTWMVRPEDAGIRKDGEPVILKSDRSGDTYVQAPNGRIERGVVKVRGKAARKAEKRARRQAREQGRRS